MRLHARCTLRPYLKPDLSAIASAHQNRINTETLEPIHSVDLDSSFRPTDPHGRIWDYYLAVKKGSVSHPVYVEVHNVDVDEVDRLKRKLSWLQDRIAAEFWPVSPDVPFLIAGKNKLKHGPNANDLALQGIEIIGKGDRIATLLP